MLTVKKGFPGEGLRLAPMSNQVIDATVCLAISFGGDDGMSQTYELNSMDAYNVNTMGDPNSGLFELGVACIKTALFNVRADNAKKREQAAQFETAIRKIENECNLLRS
jgi:hypothetical protein